MKKIPLTLFAFLAVTIPAFAQWTVFGSQSNIENNNAGFVGVLTSLYVSPSFVYGAIPSGSVVVGTGPSMGVYFPLPTNSSWQHYIKLDQTNNQVVIADGNSDGGGGFSRPGVNTGETRFFSSNGYSTGAYMTFYIGSTEYARFDGSGNFGIGTTNPNGYKLAVNGRAVATSMTVEGYPFADYVFNKDYRLPSLSYLKNYIDQYHHLPEVPSEAQVKKEGLNLGAMNTLLLKKVEELTLYLIEIKKENDRLKRDQKKLTRILKRNHIK